MRELTIYLAGAMSNLTYEQMNSWRVRLKKNILQEVLLYDVKARIINPVSYYNFEYPVYKTEKEVMQFDLNLVRNSDIVIVNLDGLNTSIGTCIELYEAMKNNIPVLAFGDIETYDETYENLHPWIKECISRVDSSEKELIEYLKDFYFT